MRGADLGLVAVVLLLLLLAATVGPLVRRIDPRPLDELAALDAWFAGAARDPWGREWVTTGAITQFMGIPGQRRPNAPTVSAPSTLHGVISCGPNGVSGDEDDVDVGAIAADGVRSCLFPPPGLAPLRRLHHAPLSLVLGLCLARFASGRLRRRPPLPGRLLAALGLSLLASTNVLVALLASGVGEWASTQPLLPGGRSPTVLGILATTWAGVLVLVLLHRELGDVPPLEPEPAPQ